MWTLRPIDFGNLPGWADDDHLAALYAFARQSKKPADVTYNQGSMGIPPQDFADLVELAGGDSAKRAPRLFFEENFAAYAISNDDGQMGQITAFYEPDVEAQIERGGLFQTPIFRRPSDLLALNDENRPKQLDDSYRFGRKSDGGSIEAYFDRAQINAGAIDNRTTAIAYLKDPIDAFFVHIQGAARLKLSDGTTMRITYDGKSGHPFTPIGKLLVQRGEIDAGDISMQTIKAWLRANPDKASQLMEENRSYIFFQQSDDTDPILGPIAAAKVPLTEGRSLAVDRLLHTFGTPIFVNAQYVNGMPFSRLMVAQETGTAIVGPERGDIFFGTGDAAGELAGAVNSKCEFTLLIPKASDFKSERVRVT